MVAHAEIRVVHRGGSKINFREPVITNDSRFALSSMDMEQRDYDSRTALHVAAAEGHAEVVRFLLEACKVNPVPIDRWDKTPMEDVLHFGHHDMVTILQDYQNKYNPQEAPKKDKETAENNLGGLL
ncbi:glutaminase kidney isoform, mitochondrial-like isoform X1 [Salvelinus sp. IW2-2015]|uniref:glutaminase kidney isoform, mitochondrial-like isoform X1 n=1 Tax=Salvelinus sp. IW2-2015 TaxID=2691554 RepID=UPI000CDF8D73|nr:glutaminase kidney isoform, mitochondrial-like isoform X1 [Salvelinus alpinus]